MSSARAASATLSVWLLSSALAGCSLLVDSELDGRDFGKKLGFSEGDGGKRAPDGGDERGSEAGSGRGGSGAGGRGGNGAGGSAGVGMDSGSGMDGGPGDDGGMDGGELDAADGQAQDGSTPAPLTITSTTPAADSSTSANVISIAIMFSEPVDMLHGVDLQVRDAGGVIAGGLMTSGETVTFTPDQPLTAIGSYDVTVGANVTARESGMKLGAEQHWTFSIAPGFAGDAALIDRATTAGGSHPAVAVDDSGNAIVVWVQDGATAGTSEIWYAFYLSGGTWGSANKLDGSGGQVGPPSVAMAPDGSVFVAWTQWSGTAGENASVLVRRFDATTGTGWSGTTLDSDPDPSPASRPVGVGVSSAGRAVVAWGRGASSTANGIGHLFFAAFAQGSWSSASEVLSGTSSVNASGELQVAVDSTGRAAIGVFANTNATLFVQNTGSAGWTEPFSDYDYTNVRRMAVAVDASDVFYAGCHDPEGGGNEVARVGSGAVQLQEATVGNSAYELDPKLSVAADTDAVAAFLAVHEGATTVSVQALAYDASASSWSAQATDLFPDRGALVPSQPDVAVYGTSALIAWESGGQLYTVERDTNGNYGAPTMRDDVSAAVVADSVQVAAAGNGAGVIVWAEASSPPRIAAQTFRGVR